MPFFQRVKAPKQPGLTSLKPRNALLDRLMAYRYYLLQHRQIRRSASATGCVRHVSKCLDLSIKEHTFSSEYPILEFDFLTRLVEEADILSITEALPYLALLTFLFLHNSRECRDTRNASHAS